MITVKCHVLKYVFYKYYVLKLSFIFIIVKILYKMTFLKMYAAFWGGVE